MYKDSEPKPKTEQTRLAAGVFVLGGILAASALTASAASQGRGSAPSRRLMGPDANELPSRRMRPRQPLPLSPAHL